MKMYHQSRPQGEELVLAHLGMVKRVALHLKARVPAYMELDELIQVGMMGLLEASRVFDAAKGVDFENFAHSRVRGAMLDEVRRLSFLPRSAVAFNKEHNETLHALSAELGRAPTQTEIAEHMGKDGAPIQVEAKTMSAFELARAMAFILEKAAREKAQQQAEPTPDHAPQIGRAHV